MGPFASWLVQILVAWWTGWRGITGKFWLVAMLWLWLALMGLKLAGHMVGRAISYLSTMFGWVSGHGAPPPVGGHEIGYWLALGNTFFPLNEALQYTAAYVTFVLAPVCLYRILKTWIPLLSAA